MSEADRRLPITASAEAMSERTAALERTIGRIVVRGTALRLGLHEGISEILDIGRELSHDIPIAEAIFCPAMVERPIRLASRRLAAIGARRPQ